MLTYTGSPDASGCAGLGHTHGHGHGHDTHRAILPVDDEDEEEEEVPGGAQQRELSMEAAFQQMFGTPERVAEIKQGILDGEGCMVSATAARCRGPLLADPS